MEFITTVHKLVARICDYCKQNNLPEPGQVRTTKLVYLIDCHYYPWEQKILTDLDWIFRHYGPWSPTLSKVLKRDFEIPQENEPEPGHFIPVHWTVPEFDTPKLKFSNVTAEGIVLNVLGRFADMPYNKLLDYIYFETAPMKDAIKGRPLDFSGILKPQRFVDPVNMLPTKVFNELREKFLRLHISKPSGREVSGLVDEGILQFIDALDEDGLFTLPEGEVLVDERVESELREYLRD